MCSDGARERFFMQIWMTMKRSSMYMAGVLLAVGTGLPAQAEPETDSPAPDRVIVKFKPVGIAGQGALNAENARRAIGARFLRKFHRIPNLEVWELPPQQGVDQAIRRLQASPLVEYAQPDYRYQVADVTPLIPNDYWYTTLWHYNNTAAGSDRTLDADIDAPEAWAVTTDASQVIVAVIDTGMTLIDAAHTIPHRDLQGNLWQNPAEAAGAPGVDDDSNGYVDDIYGINAITGTGDVYDDHFSGSGVASHGTHVAGSIGAMGNNGPAYESDVVGIGWSARIMPLKFLNSSGFGALSDAVECIDYAIANGAQIINASWGGTTFDQALLDAITAARDAGILFVTAAGNSGVDIDVTPHYPASFNVENIVAVAATGYNDELALFPNSKKLSNYGRNTVDLGAPGLRILSTVNPNVWGANVGWLDGTSMAAPQVSGTCALLWSYVASQNPTYQQIRDQVLATVDVPTYNASIDPATYITDKTITGGRVNTFKALTGLFAPAGFTAAVTGRLAILDWDDTNLVESGYEIWQSSSLTGAFYLVDTVSVNTTTYTTRPLAKGKYRFFVRAINAHGAPVDSAIATVRIK